MSEKALARLQVDYPKRWGLRAEEVAHVLGRKTTRGAVQRVREGLQRGRYPGAKKVDGHWQLPLEELAEILDPSPKATPIIPAASTHAAPSATGRRKSAIGPRLAFVRSAYFWAQVFRSLGDTDTAKKIANEAQAMRAEGRLARDIERAEEQSAALKAGTGACSAQPSGRRSL